MDPTWLGLGFTAAGVVLSYVVALYKARREIRDMRKGELDDLRSEIAEQIGSKLDAVIQSVDRLGKSVDRLHGEVTDLKVRVAIHDDRFRRPSLRAVSEGS